MKCRQALQKHQRNKIKNVCVWGRCNTAPFLCKGENMNIEKEIKKIKDIYDTLKHWDLYIKEKKRVAMYGSGTKFADKVQTSKQPYAMQNKIIDYIEFEQSREALLEVFVNKSGQLEDIIFKYANTTYQASQICEYMLNRKKKTTTIEKGIAHIQKKLNREQEAALYSENVKRLLMGGCTPCKVCEGGSITLIKEMQDRFIFGCDKCKKKYRTMKIYADIGEPEETKEKIEE